MRSVLTRKAGIATALALVLAGAAPLPAAARDIEVRIGDFAFAPQRLTVKAGATVTWINDDDIPHTVASSTKLYKSKALDTNDRFSFTTPGTYEYFCSLHPHMTGTVVVEAATGNTAAR